MTLSKSTLGLQTSKQNMLDVVGQPEGKATQGHRLDETIWDELKCGEDAALGASKKSPFQEELPQPLHIVWFLNRLFPWRQLSSSLVAEIGMAINKGPGTSIVDLFMLATRCSHL